MGKRIKCGECRKPIKGNVKSHEFVPYRKAMHCTMCGKAYCLEHYELGPWRRYAMTMDDDLREAKCPKGHTVNETGSGDMSASNPA